MDDYNRGKRDIMLEMDPEKIWWMLLPELRLWKVILMGFRRTKWDLVRKISLLESGARF